MWVVYVEDESDFIGMFDVEDDAYEFQQSYAAQSGRVVYLTARSIPYRKSDHVVYASLYADEA